MADDSLVSHEMSICCPKYGNTVGDLGESTDVE